MGTFLISTCCGGVTAAAAEMGMSPFPDLPAASSPWRPLRIRSRSAGKYIAAISCRRCHQGVRETLGLAVRSNPWQSQQHVLEQRRAGSRQTDDEDEA